MIDNQTVQVEIRLNILCDYKLAFDTRMFYTFNVNGEIIFEYDINPAPFIPILPRLGTIFEIDDQFKNVTWYGRGPYETYPDRKDGAKIGIYSATVDELFVPYVYPQENGNRTDVRWICLTNDDGFGFIVRGEELLNASASYYNAHDLTIAKHNHELIKNEYITLNIDHKMAGVGNGSLRAETLQEYRIFPERTRYSFSLNPILKEDFNSINNFNSKCVTYL